MKKDKKDIKNRKNKKLSILKFIGIFIGFQFCFALVTMPALVFYGPFDNIKKTIVGMSWNSGNHQYISRFFLSLDAIHRILGSGYASSVIQDSEKINVLKFKNSHSNRIEVYNIDGGTFKGKMMVVDDPTSVKVGCSTRIPTAGETTSVISKRNKAVAAINAGGFNDKGMTGTGGAPMGFIIHDGKVLYNTGGTQSKRDTVAFTDQGMLIVGKHSIEQLKQYGVKEAVSFGPPIIVNGKPTIESGDGGWGIAPRTAIGQTEDGKVLMLTIDGRRIGSLGASIRDVQDIFLQYKAVNATNLDGGSSTTMFFDGKVINHPSDSLGERAVPTIFMVIQNN